MLTLRSVFNSEVCFSLLFKTVLKKKIGEDYCISFIHCNKLFTFLSDWPAMAAMLYVYVSHIWKINESSKSSQAPFISWQSFNLRVWYSSQLFSVNLIWIQFKAYEIYVTKVLLVFPILCFIFFFYAVPCGKATKLDSLIYLALYLGLFSYSLFILSLLVFRL